MTKDTRAHDFEKRMESMIQELERKHEEDRAKAEAKFDEIAKMFRELMSQNKNPVRDHSDSEKDSG